MAITKIGTTGISNNLDVPGYLYLSGDNKELRFYNGANYMILKASGSLSNNYTITLPVDDGTASQVLTTDGGGVLSWTTPSSGGSQSPWTGNIDAANYTLSNVSNSGSDWTNGVLTIARGTSGAVRSNLDSYSAGTDGGAIQFRHSRHTTIGSHTALNANDDLGKIRFYGSDGSSFSNAAIIQAFANQNFASNTHGSRIEFWTAPDGADVAVKHMTIENNGAVTMPYLPCVYVAATSDVPNVTGDNTVYTVALATEIFDQGADFASNVFTAPVTGRYLVNARVRFSGHGGTSMNDAHIRIVTPDDTFHFIGATTDMGTWCIGASSLVELAAGETCYLQFVVGNAGKVVDLGTTNRGTAMSVHLVA